MIVANTTYQIAPWADALFAMDRQWWEVHHEQVAAKFLGERFSNNPLPTKYKVTKLPNATFKPFGNSGAACVSLAAMMGAQHIVMLGYDCQKTDNKAHWHGDHPKQLGNAGAINRWPAKFRELARHVGNVNVINASRATALDMFPRMDLEDALKIAA